ncbi:hypothetical protein VTL71DRAFT_2506 [Oculimacula yallundae]|uniref:Uncharacterized protein n=1 Tax=Oculimacula yallundae TaxID=86028 RepID=A0ABR4C922_9HELO
MSHNIVRNPTQLNAFSNSRRLSLKADSPRNFSLTYILAFSSLKAEAHSTKRLHEISPNKDTSIIPPLCLNTRKRHPPLHRSAVFCSRLLCCGNCSALSGKKRYRPVSKRLRTGFWYLLLRHPVHLTTGSCITSREPRPLPSNINNFKSLSLHHQDQRLRYFIISFSFPKPHFQTKGNGRFVIWYKIRIASVN